MLWKFPIESRGRRKKIQEVHCSFLNFIYYCSSNRKHLGKINVPSNFLLFPLMCLLLSLNSGYNGKIMAYLI